MYHESPNARPGQPLRSWTAKSDVLEIDAIFTVRMADARDALSRIILGQSLSSEDQLALARLNSYSVVRWYEPVVTFLPSAHIEPELAAFFKSMLTKI